MNSSLTIDILIPCFNESNFLHRLFDVLLEEELNWGSGFNVVFSDNKSQDSSISIAKSYKNKFQNLVILEQEFNVGARENWGRLLEKSHSDFFIFIDAHDLITPGYLSNLKTKSKLEQSNLMFMGEKLRLIGEQDTKFIERDNFRYSFSDSARIRFWQCVFYLNHSTEIHAVLPATARNASILLNSNTFNFDHTYIFFALVNNNFLYCDDGGYIRRYWPANDENHSHNNSLGVTETRHQRAVGMSNQVASNETMSIEILKHWSGVLSKIEIITANKLLYLKYNTEYELNVFFRVSRFLFGNLTPWKVSPV